MSDSESSLNDAGVQERAPADLQQAAGQDDLSSSGASEEQRQEVVVQKSQSKEASQTIIEFVRDRDQIMQGYKLAACMRALCLAFDMEPSDRFTKSTESPDWYTALCNQAEQYSTDDLVRGVKILINQRRTIETFNELWGFDLLPLFLGQRMEETKPDVNTPFPDTAKARVLFEILNHINPHVFRYVFDEFQDSKLVAFVNFVAMFPLYCCPSQQLKQEAKQLIDKWRAPLRQARKAAIELAKDKDEDEDDEDAQEGRRRKKQQIAFATFENNDYELQQNMERVRQREEQEKMAKE